MPETLDCTYTLSRLDGAHDVSYTLSRLDGAHDVSRLCAALSLPTPTPDVTLATILDARAMTAADVYARLSGSDDPRLMVTVRKLREVTVKRLPPDPRLNPKPMPPLGHAAPRAKPVAPTVGDAAAAAPTPLRAPTEVKREVSQWLVPGAVLVHLAPNPKQPGTLAWQRYRGYELGRSFAELRAAGVTASDVRWDAERGFVKFAVPAPVPTSVVVADDDLSAAA